MKCQNQETYSYSKSVSFWIINRFSNYASTVNFKSNNKDGSANFQLQSNCFRITAISIHSPSFSETQT